MGKKGIMFKNRSNVNSTDSLDFYTNFR